MRLIIPITAFILTIHAKAEGEFAPSNKFSGDFRYRHQETTDKQKETRLFHRLIFRVGQTFEIQQDLKFTYRLMTGSGYNTGTTSIGEKNTTQGSSRYTIGLDQAYVTYLPEQNVSLYLGKMPQFFYSAGKNQILLDRDITPEGLGAQYKQSFNEQELDLSLNLASLWVREKYDDTAGKDLTDTFLNVAQATLIYKINSDFSTQLGLGLYTYTDVQGSKPNELAIQSALDFRGNTPDGVGNYLNDYKITQSLIEVKWAKSPFDISVFFEHLKNGGADSLNEAQIYGLGFSYEKFHLSLMRQTVESDAVLAIYTGSDYSGGQSNSRGDVVLVGYKLNKNAIINFWYSTAERNIETTPTNYKISFLELTVMF